MPISGSSESDSNDSLKEKVKFVSESVADMKDCIKELERRVRHMETEGMDGIRKSIYKLENHVSNFKNANDDHKERWNMILNFAVQLIWVVMASYVLTKLGLGTGAL